MALTGLGYVGIRSQQLENWSSYALNLLGLQEVDRSRSTRAFRMDDRRQRLIVNETSGEGLDFFGWEVADATALNHLAARLDNAGVTVRMGSKSLAMQRFVTGLIEFSDPVGNRLEAFYGPQVAEDNFVPGRNLSGFVTGALGMGHIVLSVDRLDAVIPFYRDLLGFKLSDYFTRPFRIYFFHVNQRHHSLALLETGTNGIHHIMMELFNLDDVGQAYDIQLTQPEGIGATFGRHSNDYMTSFYSFSPSRFMVEYGWGGRIVDPDWTGGEVPEGPSLWGHERTWLPPERQAEAREMRMQAARDGIRHPVNVMDGNYRLSPGVCPWVDKTLLEERS
ncbi:VOC family protein [Bradyrhizobium sp. STM 3561]|uniref:VOC family protein n=1 Tax=unclassified Bradyrhizobium TaxID=2631580 RepID=UPI00388D032E